MKAGWIEMRLGDFCEIYQPKTISVKEMIKSGKYPVFGANGIIGRYSKFNHEDPQLLLGCRGSCGFVNISLPKSWITGNAMVVRAKAEVSSLSFMRYLLQGAVDFSSVITGTAQPQITRKSLSPVKVPIPSLEEQQQIVKILDEVFARLDEARSNVAKNIENCKELFQSALHESLKDAEKKGWEERQLGDVAKIVNGGTPKSNMSEFWHGSIQWLTPKDMGKMDGDSISETPRTITEDGLRQSSAKLIPPNSVIISTRAPIGHLAINTVTMAFNQGCRGLVPFSFLDARYLFYFLKIRRNDLEEMGKGTTFKELPRNTLQTFKIPLPSIEEQKNIVEKFDAVRSQTDQLQQEYIAQLADIDELRQSILQKAFAGELT